MSTSELHLAHKVAQARLDGGRELLNVLTDAGHMSPLQCQAAEQALLPLQAREATAWKAYMACFGGAQVVAEVRVIAPRLLARHRRYQRVQERRTSTHPHFFLPSAAFPTCMP